MKTEYEERIRTLFPDLKIQEIDFNGEGLVNDVLVVNGNTVFRFAKGAHGVKVLGAETLVLELVRPHVKLKIPEPYHTDRDLIVYKLIKGEPLTRDLISSLADQSKQFVADQLAVFLRALHRVPLDPGLPQTSAPANPEDWDSIRQEVEEEVYPQLMGHQVDWAKNLFDSMLNTPARLEYEPCLIHGDLGSYHILFNKPAIRIEGVIDFGVAGIGDPATDLGNLIQIYGMTFVRRLQARYPESRMLLERAKFYAQAIELQWALSGIKTADGFWFLAHLGGARDLL